MSVYQAAMFFIICPLILDLIHVMIGSLFCGNKFRIIILLCCYLMTTVIIPILILYVHYFDILGKIETLYGVASILIFRIIVVFCFSIGKFFITMWNGGPVD